MRGGNTMFRTKTYGIIAICIIGLIMIGCAPAATPTPDPTATPEPSPTPIPFANTCLVTDIGTINDGGFNQYAYEGLLKAREDYSLPEPTILESSNEEDYTENIARCLENGADAIVTVGFLLESASVEAARENPSVYFIGVDQDASGVDDAPANYTGVQFREDQAGFLVGVLAALIANEQESDVIAGIYGLPVPAVKRFRNGYEQGALSVNPDWEIGTNILGAYEESFVDETVGIAAAASYLAQDASVIFGAGGPMGAAGIRYAAQQDVYVIGVDQDEYYTTFQEGTVDGSEYLVSSALKRVDQGVYDLISLLAEGQFESFPGATNYTLDATRGGIGFATKHDADIPDEIYEQVSATLRQLVAGDINTGVDVNTGDLIENSDS